MKYGISLVIPMYFLCRPAISLLLISTSSEILISNRDRMLHVLISITRKITIYSHLFVLKRVKRVSCAMHLHARERERKISRMGDCSENLGEKMKAKRIHYKYSITAYACGLACKSTMKKMIVVRR